MSTSEEGIIISPRSAVKSAKIQELLDTFERHANPLDVPHIEIRGARISLQNKLSEAQTELKSLTKHYKDAINEKKILQSKLITNEEIIEQLHKQCEQESLKLQNLEKQNMILQDENRMLKQKISLYNLDRNNGEISDNLEENNFNLKKSFNEMKTSQDDILSDSKPNYYELYLQITEENKELKSKLLRVNKEKLEKELQKEKKVQKKVTMEINSSNEMTPKLKKRSSSYSTSPYQRTYITLSNLDNSLDGHKKKKNKVSFGKASSDRTTKKSISMSKIGSKKVEYMNVPSSKSEFLCSGDYNDDLFLKSKVQLQKELEVLLSLGETLRAELQDEKKQHSITKNKLQECKLKNSELEARTSNGITGIIRRNSNKSNSPQGVMKMDIDKKNNSNSDLTKELIHIENNQYYNVGESHFSFNHYAEVYDLQDSIAEMISFADFLINCAPAN